VAVAHSYTTKMRNTTSNQAGKFYEEYSTSLDANSPPPAVFQPIPIDMRNAGRDPEKHDEMNRQGVGVGEPGDPAHTVTSAFVHGFANGMAVRRLTPVECERLQGFPDNYTNIPWRKKDESPDGPRYKALGNSWAVPVVRWIGKRIQGNLS
jgi:site-specific DNA-cytosine methylase